MKTAISVEGDLLNQADQVARKLGLSRSRLFSMALQAFLRTCSQAETLERLNRVYDGESDPEDRRTTIAMKARFRSTIRERW